MITDQTATVQSTSEFIDYVADNEKSIAAFAFLYILIDVSGDLPPLPVHL